MNKTMGQRIDAFDAYFRSANGVPPNARVTVPTAEWEALRDGFSQQAKPAIEDAGLYVKALTVALNRVLHPGMIDEFNIALGALEREREKEAAAALQAAPPAPAAVAVPERAAFESDWQRRHYHLSMNTRQRDDGRYGDHIIQGQWETWQARAALAAAPAQEHATQLAGGAPTKADIDALVFVHSLRQAGDPTYDVVIAALERWAAAPAQAQEDSALANVVQQVFDALQDKIDARGPVAKGNLQHYVNLLREAFEAAPDTQAQDCTRSHPHEEMTPMCVLRTEIARLNHAAAVTQAQEDARDALLTEAQIEAAAKAVAECMDFPWAHMVERGRATMREHAKTIIDASRAAQGGA